MMFVVVYLYNNMITKLYIFISALMQVATDKGYYYILILLIFAIEQSGNMIIYFKENYVSVFGYV